MEKREQLTRTCSSCGLQKPLSNFLELSTTKGTTYGTICSACRSIQTKSTPKVPGEEDRTTTTSSLRIGAKQKVEIEKKQKLSQQRTSEDNILEQKRRDADEAKKSEKKENRIKSEKDHRRAYLQQKQDFLDFNKKRTSDTKQNIARQLRTAEQSKQQVALETAKLTEALKNELQLTTLDLTVPFLSPHVAKILFQSEAFQRFLALYGDLPMMTLQRLYTKNALMQTKLGPQPTSPTGDNAELSKDYLEKNLNPSRRR